MLHRSNVLRHGRRHLYEAMDWAGARAIRGVPTFLVVTLGGLLVAAFVIFGAFLVALARIEEVQRPIDREEPPSPRTAAGLSRLSTSCCGLAR